MRSQARRAAASSHGWIRGSPAAAEGGTRCRGATYCGTIGLSPWRKPSAPEPRLAILVPCLDEEDGVASVVTEYRRAFPTARILVVDNGSTDRTAERARAAGAEVVREPRPGKARAILTAFTLLDEDLVIMVDGDGSYPAEGAIRLLGDVAGRPRRHGDGNPEGPPRRPRCSDASTGSAAPPSAPPSASCFTTLPGTSSRGCACSRGGSTRTCRSSSAASSWRPS